MYDCMMANKSSNNILTYANNLFLLSFHEETQESKYFVHVKYVVKNETRIFTAFFLTAV
jgi:hypothetical protein